MTVTLYFLRHGQTEFSRHNAYCGELDPELTPAGQAMAEAFAHHYQTMNWGAAYVSPMRRTIATAKPLCEALNLPMILHDGIKELRYGQWEGHSEAEVKQAYPENYLNWITEPAWNAPTDGETTVEVATRSAIVIDEILQKHKTGNILVVSHKATIRIMLCSLLGIELGRYRNRMGMPVASVSVVEFGIHGPLLQRLGDREHLSQELRNLPGT